MDIMLALGIIFVVMGHSYQPPVLRPWAYTFQVALFFFISGYFFVAQDSIRAKGLWTAKKFRHLLIPYFIFNLFFCLLTMILANYGLNPKGDASWFGFFIRPFLDGHQYPLFLAAWFVPQLFLVHILAQWLIPRNRRPALFILLAVSSVIAFLFFYLPGEPSGPTLVFFRSAFALSVYLWGAVFKIYEEAARSFLVSPFWLLAVYSCYLVLELLQGDFSYSLVFLQFNGGPAITFLGTFSAILLIYISSDYLARFLRPDNFVYQIGRHTFSIMSLHLLVFWLINLALLVFGSVPISVLSRRLIFLAQPQLWWVYLGLGVVLPVLSAVAYEKVSHEFIFKSKNI